MGKKFKSKILILLFLLSIILISIIYIIIFEKPKTTPVLNQETTDYFSEVTKTPSNQKTSPSPEKYDFYEFSHDITFSLPDKSIFYYKNNNIYLRKISPKFELSSETLFTSQLPEISEFTVTSDRKYLIYRYNTEKNKNGKYYVADNSSHKVELKNIKTGEIKTIFTSSNETGQIISISSFSDFNSVFISTDLGKLFVYNINESKITDITYQSDKNKTIDDFCVGYNVIDQLDNFLLLKSFCYEGSDYYLYNYQTKNRISLGRSYASGYVASKFIDNGSFYAYKHEEDKITFLGKYNLQNQLVQELPIPSSSNDDSHIFTKNKSEQKDYFLTSRNNILKEKGDVTKLSKNGQLIGEDIKLILVIK